MFRFVSRNLKKSLLLSRKLRLPLSKKPFIRKKIRSHMSDAMIRVPAAAARNLKTATASFVNLN